MIPSTIIHFSGFHGFLIFSFSEFVNIGFNMRNLVPIILNIFINLLKLITYFSQCNQSVYYVGSPSTSTQCHQHHCVLGQKACWSLSLCTLPTFFITCLFTCRACWLRPSPCLLSCTFLSLACTSCGSTVSYCPHTPSFCVTSSMDLIALPSLQVFNISFWNHFLSV